MKIPAAFCENTEWLLMMAGSKAHQIASDLLKEFGVSVREMTVMKIVDGQKISQQEIAELISVNRNAIVDVTDSLEAKGLAVRQQNPENRRQQFVILTEEGERRMHAWNGYKTPQRFWVGEVLDKKECEQFQSYVVRLLQNGR